MLGKQMLSIKIVAVGDSKIGKSTLLWSRKCRPSGGELPQDGELPVVLDDISVQSVTPEGRPCNLSLWDTSGWTSEYGTMRPLAYPNTDIFLICFSTVDPKSLENVRGQWIPEINHWVPETPFLLVGTKIDLREDQVTLEKNDSVIRHKEGLDAAMEIGAEDYMECSSLTMEGVEKVFDQAIIQALKHRAKCENQKKKTMCRIT